MRKITKIIVHCSATAEGRHFTAADIRRWHKAQGWSDIGYHYVVLLDGTIEQGRPVDKEGAHCKGHNADSIGVCYIGGLDADGRTPKDTRTTAQKAALHVLLYRLQQQYPGAGIYGHNDFARKACPSFNVRKEYGTGRIAAPSAQDAATYLLAFLFVLFSVVAACVGCTGGRTAEASVAVREVVRHDTLHHLALRTDTFWARDTFLLRTEARGCTLLVDRTEVRWRDRMRTVRDTVRVASAGRVADTLRTASARPAAAKDADRGETWVWRALKRFAFIAAAFFVAAVVWTAVSLELDRKRRKNDP